MNTISNIIAILSKEDKKKFIAELKHKNKRNDTKNLQLFQLLDNPTISNNLDEVIYGKSAKGAYHALSKRLHDSLIDFIATKNFDGESSEEMSALKLMLASRIFFQHQQYKIAFKTLSKAEIKATKYSFFSILNEIYQTQIMYAHVKDALDLTELIDKYKTNKSNLHLEEKLNLFYATIQKELSIRDSKVIDIIEKNLVLYDISIDQNLTYQSLYKILDICNQVGNATRDYYAILNFIESACLHIETSERIEGKHLNEHIQVLYYLANMNFRIKKFEASRYYLDRMHYYMKLSQNKFYNAFFPQYTLLENLLHIYTGKVSLAISNFTNFDYLKYQKQQEYILDLKLALMASLFLQNNFKEALQVCGQLHHSDTYYAKKASHIWVIKKNLVEILILIELDYLDLVESRLNSFVKKHRNRLIQFEATRILDFLKLMKIYYFKTEDITSENFKIKIDSLLQIKENTEDIFVLSFCAWLQSKIDNTEMYQTCLNYIHQK